MAENAFSLAVKAGLDKKLSAMEYLLNTEGKTLEEAQAILTEVKGE